MTAMHCPAMALLLAGLFSATSITRGSETNGYSRPNIVFIMSDDHAAHGLSCYGSEIIATPQIDRLAHEGMRFTAAVGVNSLCAPARAALLTGKHSHGNGMLNNFTRFDGNQQTFPKLLQKAGYATAIVGKWHLGNAPPTGFDYYKVIRGHGSYFDCTFLETGKDWHVERGYLTNVITDCSLAWLRNRPSGKPFLLMVHHKAPHGPDVHQQRHAHLFENETIPEPATLHDDWETREPLGTGECDGTKLINCHWGQDIYRKLMATAPTEKRARTSAVYQQMIKGYMRLVASLDENVGRLLDYLNEAGLRENTIVIYTSDNGFFLGDHGMYNKMWMYEPSLTIPLLIRYPGVVPAKSVNDDLVSLLDFAPTFLDFAGAPIPDDFQGYSLRPLLGGRRTSNWRKAVYYHFHGGYGTPEHYGVRTLAHKLIHYPGFGSGNYWELFDLDTDPDEFVNLAADPANKDRRKELEETLHRLRKSTKAE